MAGALCYINGEIRSVQDGCIGITDLGLQRGYGVFDYMRTIRGIPFHFQEHMARLRRSAEALHLEPPLSNDEVLAVVERLIAGSGLNIPAIRLILTGGDSHAEPMFKHPNFIIIAEELPVHPAELYERGISLITCKYRRELPGVKSINYLNSIRLELHRRERQAADILYYSEDGISECPRSNFFIFRGNRPATPAENILAGVTRMVVSRLAGKLYPVEERNIGFNELSHIDEAFITSTSKGIMPVTMIDGRPVGDGVVGRHTRKLMALLEEYMEAYGKTETAQASLAT